MKLSDVYTAETIGLNYSEAGSNTIPYLGEGLFPSKKKAGLDLKWVKGHKGLPISLAPSNFDSASRFRDRVGVTVNESEMPFFRESMLIKEKDEQEILRVEDSNDPYAIEVLNNIFNDSQTLIDGAKVVPERMRMQLLAPLNGKVGIEISANGVDYTYNYDPNGDWKSKHYAKIETETDKWDAPETCDPIKNLEDAMDAQEEESGDRPALILMSKATFNKLKASKKVQSGVLAQNTTANVNYTSARVKSYIEEELNVSVAVYNKKFKDESGKAKNFYPDNIVMLMPASDLGSTWFGTTPEERTLKSKADANVSIVETGIAVSVTIKDDPVQTKTTASEIVLPSFERMDECYGLEVC